MKNQNYANHRQYVKGFHFFLSALLTAGMIISVINIFKHLDDSSLLSCTLIMFLFTCISYMYWFVRQFPLKAQDRAIRAEESLRYFILTGKPISAELTPAQIAALRFAYDEEFVALTERALAENLSVNQIKQSITNWRSDYHRV